VEQNIAIVNETQMRFFFALLLIFYGKANKDEEIHAVGSNSEKITNACTISTEESEKKKISRYLDAVTE
jgi:hypothetical protein